MKTEIGRLSTVRESKVGGMELVKKNVAGVDIEYYDIDGEVHMSIMQLVHSLGYRSKSAVENTITRNPKLCNSKHSIVEKVLSRNGKHYSTRLFNSLGISIIVQKADRPKQYKEAIMDFLKVDYVVMHERVEHSLLQTIITSFSHENTSREVEIGEYRVDLLFPKYNVIVECDEYGHQYYHEESEVERERYLNNSGYKVIRFNPHEKDFDIGNTISEIIQAIYTKEEIK